MTLNFNGKEIVSIVDAGYRSTDLPVVFLNTQQTSLPVIGVVRDGESDDVRLCKLYCQLERELTRLWRNAEGISTRQEALLTLRQKVAGLSQDVADLIELLQHDS